MRKICSENRDHYTLPSTQTVHPSPGIEQLDESGHFWLTISVKNHGQTPAQVTDVFLRPIVVEHGAALRSLNLGLLGRAIQGCAAHARLQRGPYNFSFESVLGH
jgi:hypothetical protein